MRMDGFLRRVLILNLALDNDFAIFFDPLLPDFDVVVFDDVALERLEAADRLLAVVDDFLLFEDAEVAFELLRLESDLVRDCGFPSIFVIFPAKLKIYPS